MTATSAPQRFAPTQALARIATGRPTAATLTYGLLAALGVVTARTMLQGLGTWNLFDWDESRHIISAYEMQQSGNYVVNTYLGAPDYWNLKPPMSFWLISASMHVFGFTPFAARLPSVVMTLLTIAVLVVFALRAGGRVAAVLTAASACTSVVLINYHSGRTADADSSFIFFSVISVLCTIGATRRPWFLLGTTTAFSLAFLTKSFHAGVLLLFAVAFLVWCRSASAVRWRHALVALAGFLPVITWIVLRYSQDGTRFLISMVQYDLLARSGGALEGHTGSPLFYVQNALLTFAPWLLVAFGAGCVLVSRRPIALRRVLHPDARVQPLLGLALWFVMVLSAFSAASTKLVWYVTSAMAVSCLLVGLLGAEALRGQGRRATVRLGAVLGLASVAALTLGAVAVNDSKSSDWPVAVQSALADVRRSEQVAGGRVYLDEALGGWSQSYAASAELGSGALPSDGALKAFEAQRGKRAIVVKEGSAAATVLHEQGAHQVSTWYGISVYALGASR